MEALPQDRDFVRKGIPDTHRSCTCLIHKHPQLCRHHCAGHSFSRENGAVFPKSREEREGGLKIFIHLTNCLMSSENFTKMYNLLNYSACRCVDPQYFLW